MSKTYYVDAFYVIVDRLGLPVPSDSVARLRSGRHLEKVILPKIDELMKTQGEYAGLSATTKADPSNVSETYYMDAFYEISERLGLSTMSISPMEALEKIILPQLDKLMTTQGEHARLSAIATAHRVCCGTEHDPANGKLHGCCVVCGVPWPCETAKRFLVADYSGQTNDESQAAMPPAALGERLEKMYHELLMMAKRSLEYDPDIEVPITLLAQAKLMLEAGKKIVALS